MNSVFPGFTNGTEVVPTQFFEEILPKIDSLSELKVTTFSFYLLNQFEGDHRYLLEDDFRETEAFMNGLSPKKEEAEFLLKEGLSKTVERGTLLKITYADKDLYFMNSRKGKSAVEQLQNGSWTPDAFLHLSAKTNMFRPTIFSLYEENIGPLTPMIADILKDAEKNYSYEWISDAIRQAVLNNARNWRYIDTILINWRENGRNGTYQ